jgi:transcriptional regulator with XRE-family HTH domain
VDRKKLNGELVRMIRQSRRLKQVEFAAKIGITQAMLSYIENGIRELNETNEGRIRQEFNIDEKAIDCLSVASLVARGEKQDER